MNIMKNLLIIIILLFAVQVIGQEIKSYDFNLYIDVRSKSILVEGNMEADFNGNDSILLILWGNSEIHSVEINNKKTSFFRDTTSPSKNMYIPGGKNLIIYKPNKAKSPVEINIKYSCNFKDLNGWAKSFSDDWIELAFYSGWFPVHEASRNFTSKLKIQIDEGYKINGSGLIEKKDGCWTINQPWPSFDMVVVASKDLKYKTLEEKNAKIELVYKDYNEPDVDSTLNECTFVINLFEKKFGKLDSVYSKRSICRI